MDKKLLFTVNLDCAEMAVRMHEAVTEQKRPPGMTPRELLSQLDPDTREVLSAASKAAVEYLTEQIETAQGIPAAQGATMN